MAHRSSDGRIGTSSRRAQGHPRATSKFGHRRRCARTRMHLALPNWYLRCERVDTQTCDPRWRAPAARQSPIGRGVQACDRLATAARRAAIPSAGERSCAGGGASRAFDAPAPVAAGPLPNVVGTSSSICAVWWIDLEGERVASKPVGTVLELRSFFPNLF
jgi:hypothetical protein